MRKLLLLLSLSTLLVGMHTASQLPETVLAQTATPDNPTTSTPKPTLAPTATPTAMSTSMPAPTSVPVAATPEPPDAPLNNDEVGFTRLGFSEQILQGPFDGTGIGFGLPADWELNDGAAVVLDLDTFFGGIGFRPTDVVTANVGGTLQVFLNNQLLSTILLNKIGEHSVSVPFTRVALDSVGNDGRHQIYVALDSALSCQFDLQTSVAIRATSHLVLPHRTVPPTTNLRLLPRPIFQDSFFPETATIVVPDQPTDAELQAALAVAAGLGRMTNSKLSLKLTPLAQLSAPVRDSTNLIMVGKPAALPLLSELQLPARVDGGSLRAAGASPDVGIVQMVVSPWNAARVVLAVSGNSDPALVKAGQAISTGLIRPGAAPNIALVKEVRALIEDAGPTTIDRTFADLGYPSRTLRGSGSHSAEYRFSAAPGQVGPADAYLDLSFNHSALLSYERSGLVVLLNGDPIGSIRFSEDTTRPDVVRLKLPRTGIRPGSNLLVVSVDMVPREVCADLRNASIWLTLRPDSLLHLPTTSAGELPVWRSDLSFYPTPFALSSLLDNTAFILAHDDPTGWDVAAQLAADLGNRADTPLASLAVAYADAIPEQIHDRRNLLAIGRPSALALVGQLGDALPAPFDPGSDIANERTMRVVYKAPPGASVGYLQIVPAPWNSKQAVMTVLGSTDEALRWAGTALLAPQQRSKLVGDLVVVDGTRLIPGDVRSIAGGGALVDATPASAAAPVSAAAPPAARPRWVLPTIGIALILMILIVVGVGVFSPRIRRVRR